MRHLPFLVLVTTAACNAQVGSDAIPAPPPESPTATPQQTFSAAEVLAARAACAEPHGAVERYETVDRLVELLSGHWVYCGDEGAGGFARFQNRHGVAQLGYEFTQDGHLYFLEQDSEGNVVRGAGIAGAFSYEIEPPHDAEYNDNSFQIYVWHADGSQGGGYATFERNPRRMLFASYRGYFVRLAGAAQ